MRHTRNKLLSFERSLPSFSIDQPVEGQMDVSGLFFIEPSGVAVEVSTTLGGIKDIEFCAGSNFQEIFSELTCTNYEIENVLEFLKQQLEWDEIEERIKSEKAAAAQQQKKELEDRKKRDQQHLEWLSQILASDPSNRYQFGWRRIFTSERAIRVFLRVDKQEHSISEMFGAKPYDLAFDSVKNEFEGKIDLPSSSSNGQPSKWAETFPHSFHVGVEALKLNSLKIIA